jgi:hypothetical protein
MKLTTATVPEDEAPGNPFEIWDGCLPLCIVFDICKICSPKSMLKNSIRGVGVNKPSPEASLEEQTLTFKGLEEENLCT